MSELTKQVTAFTINMQKLLKEKEVEQGEMVVVAQQNSIPNGFGGGDLGGTPFRSVRLDFPKFDGTDPNGWLYKTTQFFNYHQTPFTHRLLLASYHMEGQALIWFQDLESSRVLQNWEGFV